MSALLLPMEEIQIRIEKEERILVTTLTKRMAEELTEYLLNNNVRCNYIHSDVDTLERVKIMDDLRQGVYDVLIGVNLLREGLDLPEVSLVAILDADKEGFLRSHRSLTQTAGRAARNVNGMVISNLHTTKNMVLLRNKLKRPVICLFSETEQKQKILKKVPVHTWSLLHPILQLIRSYNI